MTALSALGIFISLAFAFSDMTHLPIGLGLGLARQVRCLTGQKWLWQRPLPGPTDCFAGVPHRSAVRVRTSHAGSGFQGLGTAFSDCRSMRPAWFNPVRSIGSSPGLTGVFQSINTLPQPLSRVVV